MTGSYFPIGSAYFDCGQRRSLSARTFRYWREAPRRSHAAGPRPAAAFGRHFLALLAAILFGCATADRASAQSGTLIVANKRENTVSFVDLAKGVELARSPTGSTPHELAAAPDQRHVAVVAYGGHTIDIFDTASRTKLRTIDLLGNAEPHGIKWLDDGRIVVTTQASRSLTIVDTRHGDKVLAIPTGQKGTHMMAVSPDGHRAYTANRESGTVSVIDLEKGVKLRDLAAGTWPEGISLARRGRELWVADAENAKIEIFDTHTFQRIAELNSGPKPMRVAAAPDGRHVYTSDTGDGSISEFDLRSRQIVRRIRVSGTEDAAQVTLSFSRDGKWLYAAETARNTIAEINLSSGLIVRRFNVGDGGDGLAVVKGGKR